ncbi:hypothetical protein HPB51_002061 [Rhipicephalus microplus]|uniref:Fibronectin type-III domain-containing protein n=1 Tax=Rhipicephalus microplus TaxID=6941 RepID=A0A9J6DS05_RHIMP|nr:hypothetical protein HPB51_002061 [Rhipicephalus microplus]
MRIYIATSARLFSPRTPNIILESARQRWDGGPYRALVSTSRVHVLVNGSLSVRSLETGDAGLYLCEASNGVGAELSKVVRLTVRNVPGVPESLQVSEASSRYVRLAWTEPFNGNLPLSHNRKYLYSYCTGTWEDSVAVSGTETKVTVRGLVPAASNRVDGYYVAYRREGSPEPLRYQTLHEREGVLTGLDRDTRYEVLVQAYNSKGPGPPSRTHSARTLVADPPPAPTYRVVGTTARTISLAWERPVIAFDDPPIRTYYVSWRVEGDEHPWREQSVGGDRTNFALSGLACGTRHQLRMRSASDVGRGPEGNVVTASTEGNRPVLQQPDRLVDSNSTSAWLHPEAWWHGGCPISHFTVHYRRSTEADWTLVSSHLPFRLNDEPLVLYDLEPGSWYVLLMVAHNDAGSTTAQVNFATLTLSGDVPFQKPHLLDAKMASFYRHLTVTLPIGSSVLVLVVVLAVLWCVLRRHAEDATVVHGTPQDDKEPSETWDATEGLVRDFCASKLGITVDSVARAHRLGRFVRDKKRPIIAKFFNDREIEAILNKGPKLKNTPFSISRDYSVPVRDKRRKLAQFKRSVAKEEAEMGRSFSTFPANAKYLMRTTCTGYDACQVCAMNMMHVMTTSNPASSSVSTKFRRAKADDKLYPIFTRLPLRRT